MTDAFSQVYSIQHYVMKFVSDLREVGGFYRVLRFPPRKKNWPPRYNWNIVKSVVKHYNPNPYIFQTYSLYFFSVSTMSSKEI